MSRRPPRTRSKSEGGPELGPRFSLKFDVDL
nr:MAG TPA: hypothetical protein [Caudoviricetes sp.]